MATEGDGEIYRTGFKVVRGWVNMTATPLVAIAGGSVMTFSGGVAGLGFVLLGLVIGVASRYAYSASFSAVKSADDALVLSLPWRRTTIGFGEIAMVELPESAGIFQQAGLVQLVGGERLLCPMISEGVFVRSARLATFEAALIEGGVPTRRGT